MILFTLDYRNEDCSKAGSKIRSILEGQCIHLKNFDISKMGALAIDPTLVRVRPQYLSALAQTFKYNGFQSCCMDFCCHIISILNITNINIMNLIDY